MQKLYAETYGRIAKLDIWKVLENMRVLLVKNLIFNL